MREIKYKQAILEATDQCLAADPTVYLMGLGVPDPKGIFGTTVGIVDDLVECQQDKINPLMGHDWTKTDKC